MPLATCISSRSSFFSSARLSDSLSGAPLPTPPPPLAFSLASLPIPSLRSSPAPISCSAWAPLGSFPVSSVPSLSARPAGPASPALGSDALCLACCSCSLRACSCCCFCCSWRLQRALLRKLQPKLTSALCWSSSAHRRRAGKVNLQRGGDQKRAPDPNPTSSWAIGNMGRKSWPSRP